MNVTRYISVYERVGDKLLQEFNVDIIPFEKLKETVTANDDDPELYHNYKMSFNQLEQFSKYIPSLLPIDFDNVDVWLECYQA